MKCENFMTSLEFPIMGAGIESYTKQVQGSYDLWYSRFCLWGKHRVHPSYVDFPIKGA